ncbi:hypothetical protein AG1IA_05973 [Rhizoctonia solani AG-1 IA]|uniref:Uncharacterized protein n=1 Tax=Thanatephorus cucumeris (strain AG1-IA) TaxID=983506 RepID=L8WPR2_THACA|nr:hypothetical protein AG1IA_05973 [Rhizoctonia solani AG-1 IA]
MQLSFFIPTLLLCLTSFAAGAPAASPQFKHLLTGTIITSPSESSSFIESPYGHRLTAAGYLGGNWTLATTGQKIADVYPNVGGDSGVQDITGVLHVDTRMTWKLDDGSYVWMHALGQGVAYVSDDLYIELETDSNKYSWLNNKYFIGTGTFNGAIWTIKLFGPEHDICLPLAMSTSSLPSSSPSPLPFAPAPTCVKFHLEDTLFSPVPSPLSSAYNSDSEPANDTVTYSDTSLNVEEKYTIASGLAARVDSLEDAPGTLPDEYYDAAMAPWRSAIRRRLVKNLKHESEWIGRMQVRFAR